MQREKSTSTEKKMTKHRLSRKQKADIVLSLLRGESIEELSRLHKTSVHQISQWRDLFLENGIKGLSSRSAKDTRLSELERVIGKQQMEIELLKKKTKGFGRVHANS